MEVVADPWRGQLLARLERGMARPLDASDRSCLAWCDADRTLTIHKPLLEELRARNLISNVFRSISPPRG
jgi:hypothetical protein